MNGLDFKPIEIFCGTGGVGKTTLSTSRALYLASKQINILLITIDPSKRLKEILHLDEQKAGTVATIQSTIFDSYQENPFTFDALLMSPRTTIKRIGKHDFKGPIFEILSRPYGGMNEIMSIIEVQYQLSLNRYDCIIVDTPPGKHFIDFLKSSEKIRGFFDKTFVDIFKYLGKSFGQKTESYKKAKGFLSLIVSTGIKKLLKYLEKVTGAHFVDEFIDAITKIYKNKDSFLDALNFGEDLKKREFSNWFLVTSANQQKLLEAHDLHHQATHFMHEDNYLIINKCLGPYLESWNPKSTLLHTLKNSIKTKEEIIRQFAEEDFATCLNFQEIILSDPKDQVNSLSKLWEKYDNNKEASPPSKTTVTSPKESGTLLN